MKRLVDTATEADWEWYDQEAQGVLETSADVFSNIYNVDRDDLLQEALMWVAVRPDRRRDETALRGAVKKVAQQMLKYESGKPLPMDPLMSELM